MNKSEKAFELAKKMVALQSELDEYEVDTNPLVKLIEDVSEKAVSLARAQITGFNKEFTEEDKIRWQKMAGIKPQPLTQRLKEFANRIDDETRQLAFALKYQTKDNVAQIFEGIAADRRNEIDDAIEVERAVRDCAINEAPVYYGLNASCNPAEDIIKPPTKSAYYIDVAGELNGDKIKEFTENFKEELNKKDEQ